jgi:energy-coupling factor transport system ATP-binding protein
MLGILRPQEGEIYLQGKSIKDLSLTNIGKEIGFVFQNPDKQLFCPTVSEQIGFSYNYADKASIVDSDKQIEHYLEVFDLVKHKDSSPMELSHGEKQRLALASALSRDVKFLILDEPTTGLDILRKSQLAERLLSLKEEGRGYLIIGHEAKYLTKYVDKIFVLGPEGVEII